MNQLYRAIVLIIFCAGFLLSCTKEDIDQEEIEIYLITPFKAGNNETITIKGTGFISPDSAGSIKIYFKNMAADGYVVDKNTISVVVPFGAGTGPLCVEFRGKRFCTDSSFRYITGNPGHNTYMRLADCPTAGITACVASKNAVLALSVTKCWKYDIDTDAWSMIESPQKQAIRCATFTIADKAYVFGGLEETIDATNTLQCYDPETGKWTYRAPMPSTPRWDAVAFVWKDKAYLAGGKDADDFWKNTVYNELWEYNPVTDSWRKMASLPEGIHSDGGYALRLGDKFFFPSFSFLGAQVYDPILNSWSTFNTGLVQHGAPYSVPDYEVGLIIGTRGKGEIERYIPIAGDRFHIDKYNDPPLNGYKTVSSPNYAVVNNELYYGMGYFDVTDYYYQQPQFWRYKY